MCTYLLLSGVCFPGERGRGKKRKEKKGRLGKGKEKRFKSRANWILLNSEIPLSLYIKCSFDYQYLRLLFFLDL